MVLIGKTSTIRTCRPSGSTKARSRRKCLATSIGSSASSGKGLNLWKGPIKLQDGSVYLDKGQAATDQQIWYLPQLLEGMQGQSVSK